VEPRCAECGERAVQEPPTGWDPASGPIPKWFYTDGEALCPVLGVDRYGHCGVVFV
jgi:hypothetical protein